MSRIQNSINWGTGFNITTDMPIDSRCVVSEKADLIDPTVFPKSVLYDGLIVSVVEGEENGEKEVYVLINKNGLVSQFNAETIDQDTAYSCWKKIGSDSLPNPTQPGDVLTIGSGNTIGWQTPASELPVPENEHDILTVVNNNGTLEANWKALLYLCKPTAPSDQQKCIALGGLPETTIADLRNMTIHELLDTILFMNTYTVYIGKTSTVCDGNTAWSDISNLALSISVTETCLNKEYMLDSEVSPAPLQYGYMFIALPKNVGNYRLMDGTVPLTSSYNHNNITIGSGDTPNYDLYYKTTNPGIETTIYIESI